MTYRCPLCTEEEGKPHTLLVCGAGVVEKRPVTPLDPEKMMQEQERFAEPINEHVNLEYTLAEKKELALYGWFRDSVGAGWYGLIAPIIGAIRHHNNNVDNQHIELHQIKEKFGGLRFYVSAAPEHIRTMIGKAEARSFHVCERCGMEGTRRNTSWIQTLCDDCAAPVLAAEPKYDDNGEEIS